jgi:antitoxin (DNA-binding transcriptional repressor) of toxin-antitoxin stability system
MGCSGTTSRLRLDWSEKKSHSSPMKARSITFTKNHFSSVVREVQEGATYLVCDHDRPVAVLSPVVAGNDVSDKHLMAMERDGLVRRGEGVLRADFFTDALPGAERVTGVVDALLEERDTGR